MKKKLLIIDDDVVTLKILKRYLEDKYEIQTESAAFHFTEMMDAYDMDMILLDLEMPAISGMEVFDKIRSHSKFKNVPVVFLSGVAMPNISKQIEGEYSGVIVKTSPKEEILLKVQQIFDENKVNRADADILLLYGDVLTLKSMRDSLVKIGYRVKCLCTASDSLFYLKTHTPKLIIIGRSQLGYDCHSVYESIENVLRSKDIRPILMEEPFFETELIEKVENALK